LSRDLAVVENYGVLALRNGKKWSEMELSVRPLDVIEAVRKVNAIQLASNRPPHIRPRISPAHRSGNIVLRASRITIGYPGQPLFVAQDIELHRGECVALLGSNGAGKTTFLKTLMGQLDPLDGAMQLGGSLKIGYFAQSQDHLNGDRSVLDELIAYKSMLPSEARNLLAQYLFQGEDVFKPVCVLSGGERARLALAILALQGANFLVLDEPTNHLDIPAREALQEVLENFDGTTLLVSHDRYLVDRLATQIWDLNDGQLMMFKGSYREFVLRQSAPQPAKGRQALMPPKPLLRKDSHEARRLAEMLVMLEERIHKQEQTVQRLSGQLHEAGELKAVERVNELSWQVAHAQVALDGLMEEWEKLAK
jgi:ATP-binding cassette subfamily F protein 3